MKKMLHERVKLSKSQDSAINKNSKCSRNTTQRPARRMPSTLITQLGSTGQPALLQKANQATCLKVIKENLKIFR